MTLRVVNVITTLDRGGAELLLRNTVAHFEAAAVQGAVICLAPPGSVAPLIEAHGWPVYSLEMQSGRVRPRDFLRLRRLLQQLDPNVVHTWMYHADLLGGLAARASGRRAVVWSLHHSAMPPGDVPLLTRLIARLNAALSWLVPHRIVATSRAALRFHAALGYRCARMTLIPAGFITDDLEPGRRSRIRRDIGVPDNAPLVIRVANVQPQKDYPTFMTAVAQVLEQDDDVHVVAVGRGVTAGNPDLEVPASLVANQRLHLLGAREDAAELAAASDIAVSSSAFGESTPLVIGEAMAAGVPVVATATGGCADLVGDTGRIVAPRDAAGLARAIGELLHMSGEERVQLKASAQERIRDQFSLEDMVAAYRALYRELTSR